MTLSLTSIPIITDLDFAYVEKKSIAVDQEGNIYCCFLGNPAGSYKCLYVYKSVNKGRSWKNLDFPLLISDLGPGLFAMGVDSYKNVHVVWQDSSNKQIIYTNNISGSWWRNQITLTQASTVNAQLSLAVDQSDNVHVVWYGHNLTDYTYNQVHYRKRNSNGSWTAVKVIPAMMSSHQYTPDITVIGSTCYVVWIGRKSMSNPDQIKFTTSNNGGVTWSSEILIQEHLDRWQSKPSIDGDVVNKKVFIVWEQEGSIEFSANATDDRTLVNGSLSKVIVGNTEQERYVFYTSSVGGGSRLRYCTIVNNQITRSSIEDIDPATIVTGIGGVYADGVYVISSLVSNGKHHVYLSLPSSLVEPEPEIKENKYIIKDIEGYKTYVDNAWKMIGTEPLTEAQMQAEGMTSLPSMDAIKCLNQPILYAYVLTDDTLQLQTTFIPKETLFITNVNVPLQEISQIKKVVFITAGNVKIICSNDSGVTWYGLANQIIDPTNLDDIKEKGLTTEQLVAQTEAEWTAFIGEEKILRFAYLLYPTSSGEACYVDQLKIPAEIQRDWQQGIHGTDYEYAYFENNQLKMTLKNNFTYKINYLGKE